MSPAHHAIFGFFLVHWTVTLAFTARPSSSFSPTSCKAGSSTAARNIGLTSSSPSSVSSLQATTTRLVWLTGHEDLRVRDHGGFSDAFSLQEEAAANATNDVGCLIVPVFVVDPTIHLRSKSKSALTRLHNCLSSLESDLEKLSSSSPSQHSPLSPLVIRTGSASTILPSLARDAHATSCHVIADDVISDMRTSQRATCDCLAEMGVNVRRWTNALRPSAPWSSTTAADEERVLMPSLYSEYCEIADNLPIPSPRNSHHVMAVTKTNNNNKMNMMKIHSDGLPSLEKFFDLAGLATPSAVTEFRRNHLSSSCILRQNGNTVEPYEQLITNQWSTEPKARIALEDYCRVGKDSFADRHFTISTNNSSGGDDDGKNSMYATASDRIVNGGRVPSDVLALREAPTRAFSSALTLGALSARDVIDAARNRHGNSMNMGIMTSDDDDAKRKNGNNNLARLLPSDDPLWGRSSEGALADVIEWREWFRLLADRSLELQEKRSSGSSSSLESLPTMGGEKVQGGDPREAGSVEYWRWKGQHLVRYLTWPAGKDYDRENEGAAPAMLLVHGFAASAEQWERLVYSLRKQNVKMNAKDGNSNSVDTSPPIFAVDLLGFGLSEKPGLSYTQYLWEAQIVDFAVEVMGAIPLVMVGNSIGGGLSAGAAASMGKTICKGLVLCNTAGILEDPDTYAGYPYDKNGENMIRSYTEAAMKGNPNEAPYTPVPLVGKSALDLFGKGVIQLIYPQIEKRLSLIYGNQLENADPAAIYAIQQSALHPGSANVIGSGQKLAPNRPLNEVLVDAVDGNDDDNSEKKSGFDVLVVMGLNDQVSSPQIAQSRVELFSRLNKSKIIVGAIPDAGHCPHDEKPDIVAEICCSWICSIVA